MLTCICDQLVILLKALFFAAAETSGILCFSTDEHFAVFLPTLSSSLESSGKLRRKFSNDVLFGSMNDTRLSLAESFSEALPSHFVGLLLFYFDLPLLVVLFVASYLSLSVML